MGVCFMAVYVTGVSWSYLTNKHLISMYLTSVYLMGCVSHRRVFMDMHLRGVYPTGVHLTGYLISVCLMGVCLIGIRLRVIYFMGHASYHPNSHPNSLARDKLTSSLSHPLAAMPRVPRPLYPRP